MYEFSVNIQHTVEDAAPCVEGLVNIPTWPQIRQYGCVKLSRNLGRHSVIK
jgi:hypothetical protein